MTISSVLVSEQLRPYFLPIHFGQLFLTAEQAVYNNLGFLCEQYKGAYWHFFELGNGGVYMAPDLNELLTICVPGNGYHGQVSADAAGIIATLFALNQLCNKSQSEKMLILYELLLDFSGEHRESREIFASID